MSQERWSQIDSYLCEVTIEPDPVLEASLEAMRAAGLPPISVSPLEGKLLHLLARGLGARKILEIGTLAGYSTIWLARALAPNGRVTTLEVDSKHADVASANFSRAGVAGLIDLRLGRALDILPQLAAEGAGPFDLIFIDADKANIPAYFDWALALSRLGGVIIVDNVVRGGSVIDPAAAEVPDIVGIRRFAERLAVETRVSATAIQTVGSKGHDGFALALVIAN